MCRVSLWVCLIGITAGTGCDLDGEVAGVDGMIRVYQWTGVEIGIKEVTLGGKSRVIDAQSLGVCAEDGDAIHTLSVRNGLIAFGQGHCLRIMEVDGGRILQEQTRSAPPLAVAWSNDGSSLAVVERDSSAGATLTILDHHFGDGGQYHIDTVIETANWHLSWSRDDALIAASMTTVDLAVADQPTTVIDIANSTKVELDMTRTYFMDDRVLIADSRRAAVSMGKPIPAASTFVADLNLYEIEQITDRRIVPCDVGAMASDPRAGIAAVGIAGAALGFPRALNIRIVDVNGRVSKSDDKKPPPGTIGTSYSMSLVAE